MLPALFSAEGALVQFIQKYGVLGLWFSTFLESVGVPFTSAIVAFTAASIIASGRITAGQAIAISTLGLLAGSSVSYALGYYSVKWGKNLIAKTGSPPAQAERGRERDRFWSTSRPAIVSFMDKYGNFSILLAQLFGFTRALISYPAGALGFNLLKFLLYTALGGLIFSTFAVLGSFFITRFLLQLLSSAYFWLLLAGGGAGGFLCVRCRKKIVS